MPTLTIRNMNQTEIPLARPDKTLLRYIQEAGIDWMHACGGKGRCTTCKMRVLEGVGHLGPRSAAEVKYFAAGKLRKDERLACQCRAASDVVVEVPLDSQLPHLKYN